VSGRRDARPALAIFGLLAAAPNVFGVRESPHDSYDRVRSLLQRYVDQTYSYVDAIVLLMTDDDRDVRTLLTVDSSLAAHRFSHPVNVELPHP
jgi:predicted nucleic acid-binding protein